MSEYIATCSEVVGIGEKTWIVPDYIDISKEIVRCKDCRFYGKGDSGWWCKKSITLVPDPDGFCAWGERKVVD